MKMKNIVGSVDEKILQNKEFMETKDSLGDRIKSFEDTYRYYISDNKLPLIIRLDGKSFHTVTKKCEKPFDVELIRAMNKTAKYVCNNIPGSRFAYTQSDEISILVINYDNKNTKPWFNNNIQKIASVSASLASVMFSKQSPTIFGEEKLVVFDSRVFSIPEFEVGNYFKWRQDDCIRNSVQMLARSLYSHKECSNKNCDQLKEMCKNKGQDWNYINHHYKYGRGIIKLPFKKTIVNKHTNQESDIIRHEWWVDNNIPLFTYNHEYITKYFPSNIDNVTNI